MIKFKDSFSGFSARDLKPLIEFYGEKLGLKVDQTPEGLSITLPGGARLFVYPKPNHEPASFTVLNLKVDDIAAAAKELKSQGIVFEQYPNPPTDKDGIFRDTERNMAIAWFKDPSGNILSILQDK